MMRPIRRPNRLRQYDYSVCGTYFVTVCTAGREKLFWTHEDAGAVISRPLEAPLSQFGKTVDHAVQMIPMHYEMVRVDHYVIMPNHLHLLLTILPTEGRLIAAPTVSRVVGQMKRFVSRATGRQLWQRSFHDHIVRSQHDYERVWTYIENNPQNWEADCFHKNTAGSECDTD